MSVHERPVGKPLGFYVSSREESLKEVLKELEEKCGGHFERLTRNQLVWLLLHCVKKYGVFLETRYSFNDLYLNEFYSHYREEYPTPYKLKRVVELIDKLPDDLAFNLVPFLYDQLKP